MNLRTLNARPLLALCILPALVGCGGNSGSALLAPTGPAARAAAVSGAFPIVDPASASAVVLPFDPGNFVAVVDHPYFPLPAGRVTTFRGGAESITVEVLTEQKAILGVQATVVRDRVHADGVLIEDTIDWYAQDRQGNVWYLGEDVKNYQGGQLVSTTGSWEAGKNGATAGLIMLAHPAAGDSYAQEHAAGVAEDMTRVKDTDVAVVVPKGSFAHCIQTLEWTRLQPGKRGYKYFAQGVGLVLESSTRGGSERVELISVTGS